MRNRRATATRRQGAPTSNCEQSAVGYGALIQAADRREIYRRVQLKQRDVVRIRIVGVLRVVDDAFDGVFSHTAVGEVEAVVQADLHNDGARCGAEGTVRGGQHPGGGDQCASTEVRLAGRLKRDQPVVLPCKLHLRASDDRRREVLRLHGERGGAGARDALRHRIARRRRRRRLPNPAVGAIVADGARGPLGARPAVIALAIGVPVEAVVDALRGGLAEQGGEE
mmetsp:Transcript_18417/g.42393  ORF Transcript_18417/g.42393 Transcript_18417/m.42393 type:complete len:225 (-) Transcript_18417:53-727(-)